uniref:Uncharacterized protein n=1 Tax=Tanacetum cinerariifolium TaxID=118510 RepID=A0A6L2N6K9_TANCI|nr:hypothetical protein [Tanacetum cinerariifolium]
MGDFDRKRKSRDWEVKAKDKLGSDFGIRVCLLPFKFSSGEEEPRGMSIRQKINLDILPEEAHKYYAQFKPLEVIKQPDDEQVWFATV